MALLKGLVNLAHLSLFWPSELDLFSSWTSLNDDDTGSEQAAGGSGTLGGFLDDVGHVGFVDRFSGVSPTAVVPHMSFLQK